MMKYAKPTIENSLLRVDNATGTLPDQWEKPSEKHAFWVLELSGAEVEPVEKWTKRVVPLIRAESASLARFKKAGWKTTLHVATTRSLIPVAFDAELIEVLAASKVGLEHVSE